MFARIVACVDGKPTGLHAGEVAIETAARFGSGLTFVTVLPRSDSPEAEGLERLIPANPQGKTIHHELEEIETRAKQRGIKSTEIVYLRGAPTEAILEYLASVPPDLVVVGTRGLSRGSRLLLGSVSSRLVADAPCPVMVVRNVARPKKAG